MATAEVITTISPTTNQPILTRRGLLPDEMAGVGARARRAFEEYRQSHPTLEGRQAIVTRFLEIVLKRQDELARELTEQMGRPIAYTAKEITTAVKRAEYMNRIAGEVLTGEIPGEEEAGFKRYLVRDPVGVVLVIFAWNYPYLILVNSLIPALLAGCAVILKPSPQTPTVAEHAVAMLEEAGLPKGVVQYLHCGTPSDLQPLILSPDVAHICFTGSVAGGLAVQQVAAARVSCSVGLELGGKDPAYVRADTSEDIAWVAEEIVDGAVFNSGQSCCSIERVYAHADVYEKLVAAIQKVLSGYRLGDPMDPTTHLGPVVSKRSQQAIHKQIDEAIAAGAVDQTPKNSTFTLTAPGNYVPPVLLTNVNHSMSVMRDETFGPVIPVQKVDGDDEAIRLMNDSPYGLTASIWTRDVAKGEQLTSRVQAGTVFVNRADFPSPDLAWTGFKDSGRGVTLSRFGFDQFLRTKSVHLKDYPK